MKPFFGIDITEDKKNEDIIADRYAAASASEENTATLERLGEDTGELLEKAELPLLPRIILGVSGLLAAISFIFLLNSIIDFGFSYTFQRIPWMFLVFAITLICTIVFGLRAKKKFEEAFSSPESKRTESAIESTLNMIYGELGVPDDAKDCEVLSFAFKMKNGEPVFKAQDALSQAYMNLSKKIYVKDGVLSLADADHRYDIPLSSLHAIHTVDKRIPIFSWDKEESFKEGRYKQYKIKEDDDGTVYVKSYHILTFTLEGEELGIYFPSYELPVFEEMTGLHAIEG